MSPINIVFDLDGTLIDSAPDIQFAASAVLRDHGKEALSLEETRSFIGEGATLYVGDSETDATTAKRAEVPFALYSQEYRKSAVSEIHHDWVFDHFDALPGIVEESTAAQKI